MLIWVFVFVYAKSRFSRDEAHIEKSVTVKESLVCDIGEQITDNI